MLVCWLQTISAIFSGALFALSFPSIINGTKLPEFGFFGWICIIPIYVATYNASIKKILCLGFFAGLTSNIISQYWLFTALHGFAEYPLKLTLFVLSAAYIILAVYFAIPLAAGVWLERKTNVSRIIWIPAFWVVCDFCRNYFPFGGFPWNNLGYSQGANLEFIQIADLVGIYGVLFLLVAFNSAIGDALVGIFKRKFRIFETAIIAALLILAFGYGSYKLKQPVGNDNDKFNIGLIHGSREVGAGSERIASEEIKIINERLSKEAVQSGAELVIWPETSFFGAFRKSKYLPIKIEPFGAPFVIGGITFGKGDYYNSAFLVDTNGEIKSIYDKTHLVPLGEYVPLGKSVFKFLKVSNKKHLNFIPGRKGVLFEIPSKPDLKFGVMICYEDLFPEIARGATRNGASFLAVIASDSWFEYSSAKLQHFNFSIFRAVENRRFVVRSANKGVTGVIDPWGRVLAREDRFSEALVQADIGPTVEKSFYTKHGDWFPYCCVGLVLGGIARIIKKNRRKPV